ncbi:MAG: alpha/beta fold hydrolase [Pirellulales bacterium]|nr:alpha/beta fold hydrolase [Pirellulales bacterium]
MELLVLAVAVSTLSCGCSGNRVMLRPIPKDPLGDQLQLTSYDGPRPSQRTEQLLRIHNLTYQPKSDPRPIIRQLQAFNQRYPNSERIYAMAELAYLGGKTAEKCNEKDIALDLYGAAVLDAYEYLFDDRYRDTRNPYDPQYRSACDVYNGALEAALRIANAGKVLVPGATKTIHTASGNWVVTCKLQSTRWNPRDFARFEFCSDYEVTGLKNQYAVHGLGVPLIAVRQSYQGEPVAAKYYPQDLSFPVTALLRPVANHKTTEGDSPIFSARKSGQSPPGETPYKNAVLELHDPLDRAETRIGRGLVPLESDFTTPLAYFLSKPDLNRLDYAGLLRPEMLLDVARLNHPDPVMGLYMVQPYEPGKIPVLLVHGLWSSPMTWMEMFNDLRSIPVIRDHYQFWFYLYPTAQPFWVTAALLRHDLAAAREVLDPQHREPALDQMVLVGHSMGGLLSELQTLDSGDKYWKLVSKVPLDELKTDPEIREKLRQTFYFRPNPSIRRVVTIATPNRGSDFSNQTTQWLLSKLIQLPEMLLQSQEKLYRDNPHAFVDHSLAKVTTSIDSLSPGSPIFPVMLAARRPCWVKYHNIVGDMPGQWWMPRFLSSDTDGVVAEASAHLEGAASEIVVPADHSTVHSHPAAVLEVRRVLLEHLTELSGRPAAELARRPAP